MVLFGVGAAYGLGALGIAVAKLQGYQGISLVALYVYGILGGAGLLLLRRIYTDVDRSRKVTTEVLEKVPRHASSSAPAAIPSIQTRDFTA